MFAERYSEVTKSSLQAMELSLVTELDRIVDNHISYSLPHSSLYASCITLVADIIDAEQAGLISINSNKVNIQLTAAAAPRAMEYLLAAQIGETFAGYTHLFSSKISAEIATAHDLEGRYLTLVPIQSTNATGFDQTDGTQLLTFITAGPLHPRDLQIIAAASRKFKALNRQLNNHAELQLRIEELEAIYAIDQIRDLDLPFDEVLARVANEIIQITSADVGFLMLWQPLTEQLDLRVATDSILIELRPVRAELKTTAKKALARQTLVHAPGKSNWVGDIICMPLLLNGEHLGVIGVFNGANSVSFGHRECHLLKAIGTQVDSTLFESRERRRLREVLGRCVGSHVMEQLLKNSDVGILTGQRREATVLFADIRGSTRLSENIDPELMVTFLNDYLEEMTQVILKHNGTIDKFLGDGVMALFSAPLGQKDHPLIAVRVALEMQKVHETVRRKWQSLGIETGPLGIGIATGDMVVGEIGSVLRSDYTAIGWAVNLASRLQDAATGGQVLIAESTFDMIEDSIIAIPQLELTLQGIEDQTTAFDVVHIIQPQQLALPLS